jgi:4-alpha-glucanotransferase
LLSPDAVADVDAVVAALHRWMALTPSRMVAVALADVVGDRRAINQPGTSDEYPNWRVPLAGPDGEVVSLEDVRRADLAGPLFRALHGRPAHD